MKTQKLTAVGEAAERLRRGQLVAFPTETVFGLGADATQSLAIENLFRAKGRPSDNPLIVHLGDFEQWRLAARRMTPVAKILLEAFSPGPLTVVLPKQPALSEVVTAGLDTVGIRIPDCAVARELLRAADLPVAAPSANRSGRPSCTTWQSVLEDLQGRIDAVLCCNTAGIGLESTVVDCCGDIPLLLRTGAITLEDLQGVVPQTQAVTARDAQHRRRSPGLRHPHYQPRAPLKLWDSSGGELAPSPEAPQQVAYCGMQSFGDPERFRLHRQFASLDDYASHFYEFLREADRLGATMILCQLAPARGIGIALRDRQMRAAAS